MICGRAFLVATLTAFVVAGGAGRAAAAEYKIDPDHSTVIFKVKNRDVSYVYGRFNSITGTIVVDNDSVFVLKALKVSRDWALTVKVTRAK